MYFILDLSCCRNGGEKVQNSRSLINFENRQCGLRAAKTVMMEGGVIKSDAVRHPLEKLGAATRTELLELARAANPLALRWGR